MIPSALAQRRFSFEQSRKTSFTIPFPRHDHVTAALENRALAIQIRGLTRVGSPPTRSGSGPLDAYGIHETPVAVLSGEMLVNWYGPGAPLLKVTESTRTLVSTHGPVLLK